MAVSLKLANEYMSGTVIDETGRVISYTELLLEMEDGKHPTLKNVSPGAMSGFYDELGRSVANSPHKSGTPIGKQVK